MWEILRITHESKNDVKHVRNNVHFLKFRLKHVFLVFIILNLETFFLYLD